MLKYLYIPLAILLCHNIQSQSFHDTQGSLEIANSGQAIYTVPIALPPSLQNFGPTINLTYTSGQFGGLVGQGWNISTISYVSRISTNIALDGFIDGVDFDDNDKLALDGQRLIIKSGTYWADGSTYETEMQSNNKIELRKNGTNIYFIVTNTDGSRTWYGNYNGTILNDVNTYNIARHEDKNGNYILYEYFKPFNKGLCLKQIKFSANINVVNPPLNIILFNYKSAKRHEFSFLNNVKIWKDAILANIEVKTNDVLFRKYVVSHDEDITNGYEKVRSIQEFNSLQEPANPVLFEYENTGSSSNISEITSHYSGFLNPSAGITGGDFDGDGYIDLVNDGRIYTKLFQNNGQGDGIPINGYGFLPITTLASDNKLNQFQSGLDIDRLELFSLKFTAKHLDANSNSIVASYSKTIVFPNYAYCYSSCPNNPCQELYIARTNNPVIFEGDFNGDGISELLILSYPEQKTKQSVEHYRTPDPNHNCVTTITTGDFPDQVRILDLNPNSSTVLGSKGYVNLGFSAPFHKNNKNFVTDFNGDGKADILSINQDKSYTIIGFKQLSVSPWIEIEILGKGILPDFNKDKNVLLGDFNGDGKTDLIIPVAKYSAEWAIYYANPKAIGTNEFFSKEVETIVEYNPDSGVPGTPGAQYTMQQLFKNYYILDTNKDGKSDLVMFAVDYAKKEWWQYNNFDTKWRLFVFENNIGRSNLSSKFPLVYQSPSDHASSSPRIPIPLASSFKVNGANKEFVILRKDESNSKAVYINFPKNVQEDLLLTKVTSANNIVNDVIEYKKLEPTSNLNNGLGSSNEFYSSKNSLTYPFVEIKKIPTSSLVFKLTNTTDGVIKKQLYRYHGFAMNLHGLGFIGFNKTARSSWFQNDSAEKVWSVNEIIPELRGANKRIYSQLVPSGSDFSFTDALTPENAINISLNEFNTVSLASPYTILLDKQTSIDFLTNIKNEVKYVYSTDGFFIPRQIVSKNYLTNVLQGTTTTNTTYESNSSGTGNNYYIGRPTVVEKIISAYNDTFKTTEKYFYEQNKLKRIERKGNSTEEKYLIEEYDYTPVGNVRKTTQKTTAGITPALAARTSEQTFDSTGRFVISAKDVEGLITVKTFDPFYGQLLTQTNPFGLTTTNEYDSWGKLKKVTDYLGKSTSFTYTKEGNLIKTSVAGQDGSENYKLTDALGRTVRTGKKNVDGSWSYQAVQYDYLGRTVRESDPSVGYSTYFWNTYNYDIYNRITSKNFTSGLTVTMTYNGVTTTSTDGTKTTSSTKNANGDVVQATDPGGTIYYTYFANGNLKTSNFENTVLTMDYDSFGRKKLLNDPSAGTYTYAYNFYGDLIQETTPKGVTNYNYDDFGKILNTHVLGATANEETDILTVYSYDPSTKLLNSETITNVYDGNSSYTYEYDQFKRLRKTIEYQPLAHYQKSYQYDAFGRVATEFLHAVEITTGKSSSKMIKNTYKNGAIWTKSDDSNNKILWTTNAVNEWGQLKSGTFGNDLLQVNFYSATGLPTTLNTLKTLPNARVSLGKTNPQNPNDPIEIDPDDPPTSQTETLIGLNYNFNQERALLMSRNTNLFNNYSEQFQYDNLERLIEWVAAPEILHNLNFSGSTGTAGFTSVVGATVASFLNKLRVTAIQGNSGAQKLILSNSPLGTKINISTIVNKQNTNKIIVVLVEKNPSSADIVETVLGEANEGLFTIDYTISTFKDVYIKFVKSHLSSDVGLSTTFTVDDFIVTKFNKQSQQYDNKGRISQSGIGDYAYSINGKAYQNSSITLSPAGKDYYTQYDRQELTYNAFKSPVAIHEKNYDRISFSYNARHGRSMMFYGGLSADKWQRTYRKQYSSDGTFEIKHNTQTGNVEFLTYIGGDGYSAPVVLEGDGTNQEYLYLHRDYLGSIIAISNQDGNLIEKRHFDAWGNAVKIQNQVDNNLTSFSVLDRGYTGHEHLQSVGLIHMNGRLYDPVIHRFLQPDNFIQDPHNTQNYNRYGYVLNNPLKYTDPSGEELLSAVAIGVGVAVAAYILNAIAVEAPITFAGVMETSLMAVLSTTATFGVGSATAGIGNFFLKAGVQAVAHGTIQGGLSEFSGGKFITGFASGSLSSLASSAFSGGTNLDAKGNSLEGTGWAGAGKFAEKGVGIIAFGTVSGGLGAKLTGGNFWAGAATGFTVSAFNHAMHQMSKPKTTVAGIYGAGGEDASGNPALRELVEGQGGTMFTSSVGGGDDEIIAYLKAGFEKGNQLKLYGHSRGGAAAVRIANKLGAMHINISEMTLYDPVGMYFGGGFNFDYPNVMKVTNYYQRNPVDGVAWWANNPFQGSPVSGSFQWPTINNVNLTGQSYNGGLINHLNITRYANKNP